MSMQAVPIARIRSFIAKPSSSSSGLGDNADTANFDSWGERVATAKQSQSISNPICWPDPDSITGISEHQRSQLSIAMSKNIGLFSGGAGTGKTHCLGHLIKAILRDQPWAQIRLMAPTGKAAQRMSQAMTEAGMNLRGSTIHTGLVPTRNGHDRGGWGFAHNEHNPIYAHLLVIDESPMIDCGLMASTLAAISPGTKILFVGDPNQLPPVGKGRPYADMIEAGLPHGHLTETHRFAGRIARVCQQILAGERWQPSAKLDLDAEFPENMRHIECKPSMQLPALTDLLERLKKRGFNPIEDVQLLCATNNTRERLNGSLQSLLNPMGDKCSGNPYRIGDKIICLRNQWIEQDWGLEKKPKDCPKIYIANGEIGEAIRVEKTFVVVRVNGLNLRFNKSSWEDISHAYVITSWKAMGSQWKAQIAVTEDSRGADMIVDRSCWYTNISRGGRASFTLGERSVIDGQCARVGIYHRKTLLVEKIRAAGIVGGGFESMGWQEDFSDI